MKRFGVSTGGINDMNKNRSSVESQQHDFEIIIIEIIRNK